ncbi:MAG: hypothetical protein E7587_02600 [Ruminococcaceae bacterium]|nr:hypothetical protein [Oscillospiraceae bacterium]
MCFLFGIQIHFLSKACFLELYFFSHHTSLRNKQKRKTFVQAQLLTLLFCLYSVLPYSIPYLFRHAKHYDEDRTKHNAYLLKH